MARTNKRRIAPRTLDDIKKMALRYLVWVTSGYRFSIPETKPRNVSSMMGD